MSNATIKFNNVKIHGNDRRYDSGVIAYDDGETGCASESWMPLTIIRLTWHKGCYFEDLADGYGDGGGTGGDWSGIRDSSEIAIEKMLERALNFINGLSVKRYFEA